MPCSLHCDCGGAAHAQRTHSPHAPNLLRPNPGTRTDEIDIYGGRLLQTQWRCSKIFSMRVTYVVSVLRGPYGTQYVRTHTHTHSAIVLSAITTQHDEIP